MFNLMVMPASPALAVELSAHDAASRALLAAARVDIVGSQDKRWYTAHTGSLKAWGAATDLGGGNFLPEIIARYVLHSVPQLRTRTSRERIGKPDPEALTVVVADGSAGLTERAPLALVPEAQEAHEWCEEVLMGASASKAGKWLSQRGVIEPALWEELAGLDPKKKQLFATDATLGVGRYVAGWEV